MKLKKETLNYFDSFIKNSSYALEASKMLRNFIYNFDVSKSAEMDNEVHKIENEADQGQHIILNYLVKDFLPPIDREDIIAIAHQIDDIIDDIDEIVINIDILNVTKLRDDVKDFVDLLEKDCERLVQMFELFKNFQDFKTIKEKIIEINMFEDEGDKLYQKALKNLYRNEKDSIEVIKWTTLYNCLENCFDSCESAADCVEEVIMKNS